MLRAHWNLNGSFRGPRTRPSALINVFRGQHNHATTFITPHHVSWGVSKGFGSTMESGIQLNPTESQLRTLLLDVARNVNPQKPSELRFTGGWVRDKILGSGSHDIDVAINDMTGYEFGLKMQEYLNQEKNSAKYDLRDARGQLTGGLHKIVANPEKSKHLETVTTRIFGLDIDLVNLRKETYTELSRNPQMEFGTPEEDAMRRDATINAMFYNLTTEKVEDFTGKGLVDMESKIIRTPLEPLQTFKDDPLRVLRLIRFATRLDYTLDEPTEHAMRDPSVREALKVKISRERVGVEIEKMLKGPDPLRALQLILQNNLHATIFTDPTSSIAFIPDEQTFGLACTAAQDIQSNDLAKALTPDDEHLYRRFVLTAFIPWFDAPEVPAKAGKAQPPLATVVAREGIKATNKISDLITACVRNTDDIISVKDEALKQNQSDQQTAGRDTIGMAIRRWGATWRSQVSFAIMLEYSRGKPHESKLLLLLITLTLQGSSENTKSFFDSLSTSTLGLHMISSLSLMELHSRRHLESNQGHG